MTTLEKRLSNHWRPCQRASCPRARRVVLAVELTVACCLLGGCATPRTRHVGASGLEEAGREPTATTGDASAALPPSDDHVDDAACENKPIELVEEYWGDGSLKFRQEVVVDDEGNDVPHGLTTHYWPNGQKRLEMQYRCGVRHGPRVTWYQDGTIWSEGEFLNGKDHGHWIVWFPDATKSQEFTMVRGVWHGTHTLWDSNGVKRMEVEWVDGMRQGPLRLWEPDGNLMSEDDYVDDIRQPTPAPHASAQADATTSPAGHSATATTEK